MLNLKKGGRVCFLGDSITEGVGVGEGERYFDFLSAMLEIETVGFGVNGAQLSGVEKQAARVYEMFGDDVDAIFVFAGTNDFYGGVPIGSTFTEHSETVIVKRDDGGEPLVTNERRVREFCMDSKTVCGRLNRVLSFLKHCYHDKLIVLMTPIHRAYATFGNSNIQVQRALCKLGGSVF